MALFIAIAGQAESAGAADTAVERLSEALRADIAAQSKRSQHDERVDTEREALAQLGRDSDVDNGDSTESALQDLIGSTASDKIRGLAQSALQQLRTKRAEAEKQFAVRAEAGLGRVSEAVLKAQTARDLDPVIDEVRRLSEDYSQEGRRTRRSDATTRLGYALRAIQQWQDYLSRRETGNAVGAAQVLKDVADEENESLYIPRSEILARIRALEPEEKKQTIAAGNAILETIHSLDDLPAAVAKMRADPALPRSGDIWGVLNNLESICRSYIGWKEGAATTLNVSAMKQGDANPLVVRLHAELYLRVLPRLLGLPETEKARPGETVEDYLQRLANEARKAGNWDLLGRVLWARKQIALSIAGVWSSNTIDDYSAYLYFKQGQTQERARQYAAAVAAYRGALREGGIGIPAEVIGQHLDAIRKEHPVEFAEGEKLKKVPVENVPPQHPGSFGDDTIKVPAASPQASPTN